MPLPFLRRAFSCALTALAVGACSDLPESLTAPPEAPLVLSAQSSAAATSAQGGRFLANGIPYRNPGYELATGRSGGATMTLRALMNQDGTTDLQVTTGDFEGTEPPHDFDKLQVKYLDEAAEEAVWTENHRRPGTGLVELGFDGLERHRILQVQGNVTVPNASGKGKRTGVVTLRERVNLRPNLAVLSVAAVHEAFVDTEVSFTAAIAETNHDLSATADCVFYVNGDEAARSDGIFVGEGDQVACQMDHVFTETGTYEVTASVEHVNPGDFDTSDNQATATIEIVDPVVELHGTASAAERHHRYDYSSYYYDRHDRRDWTHAQLYASGESALEFPASVSIRQSSGGVTRSDVSLGSFGTAGASCEEHVDATTNVRICSDEGGDRTTLNVSYSSGVARYYARRLYQQRWWVCHWNGYCHYHYGSYYWVTIDNRTVVDGYGYRGLGSDYTFDVALVDADGTQFLSDPVVVPVDQPYDYPSRYVRQWGRTGFISY